jgi:protein-L-isoaspartate O-methyltransferase
MNTIQRLIKADDTRKTRFHTSNGHLCASPSEFLRAFATTVTRTVFHRYSRVPWLVFPAIDHLEPLISGRRVFEFGSGMSTLWFAKRCREVISVESDTHWHQVVTKQCRAMQNVRIIHATSKEDYLGAISSAGGKYDMILVDGLYRNDCLDLARPYLNPGGLLVVDDTDMIPYLADRIKQLFSDSRILAFRGWVSGNLHPHETTMICDIPAQGL